MLKTVQKIIQIGDELGFIIPKEILEELGLKVGDEITLTIEPAKKSEA